MLNSSRRQKSIQEFLWGEIMRALLLALLGLALSHAWAANETKISVPSSDTSTSTIATPIGDKKFESDKRITDLELRALQGSMNRYSLQFNFGYNGPPVNHLSDPHRPNPDNRPGDVRTSLMGNASARYRINPRMGVNLGTGLSFYEPYQAITGQEQDRTFNKKNYNNYGVNDPVISVDRTYKAFNTQMRTSVKTSVTTTEAYTKAGQWAMAGVSQYFKFTPGTSRMIFGMHLGLDYFAYARDYYSGDANGKGGDGNVSKYWINIIPSFEYKLTDNLNFNTSLGYAYSNLRADNSWWRWNHPLTTWRLGVGYALSHDIYINPYVNCFAEAPAFNTASLNFSTTFAIF